MPVRKIPGDPCHNIYQDSSCSRGRPGKSRYDLRPRLRGSTGTANCNLRKEWPVVGTPLAGTSIYLNRVRFDMEHTDAPGIRIRRIAGECGLSSGAHDRCSSYGGWFCGGIENSKWSRIAATPPRRATAIQRISLEGSYGLSGARRAQ